MTRDYDAWLASQYGPDIDGENQPENQEDNPPEPYNPVSRDRYTVSGNSLRMWRLDPEGNPVGDPIEWPGKVSLDIPAEDVDDTHFNPQFETFTMDLTMNTVDPALIALLTGQGAPERLTVVDGRTRWQRWLDNHLVAAWVLHGSDGGPGFSDRLLDATLDYRGTRKMVERWEAEDRDD